MTSITSPVGSSPRGAVRPSPRVRERRRRAVLIAAILATVVALAMVVADNGPTIGKFAERAWWWVNPSVATAVSSLTASADYSGLQLHWADNDRASSYTVTVATDPLLTDRVDRQTVASTQLAVAGLQQGTTYYYGVTWQSEYGNEGVASTVKSIATTVHEVTAPAAITVAATASAFSLSWAPVPFATDYTVRMSTSKDPAAFGSSPADVAFPATADTTLTTPALSKAATGEKYYFTVLADNRNLSTAESAASAGRLLIDPPQNAAAVGASTTGVTVKWDAVAGAAHYVIERSATADFATIDGSYTVPKAYSRMSINGLAPGTQYFLRVRAQSGSRTGEPSAVIAATTSSSGTANLRVATYNVLDPALGAKTLGSWSERRKNVAKTIDDSGADIVALEEAGWSKVSGGISPAQDLKKLIDTKMALSKAGKRGDEILYSPAKYAAGPHGSFNLPRTSGDGQRVGIWQEFRDKATGAHFIAVATHLTSGIENNAARVTQAKTIISRIRAVNTSALPIVLMGDMNSYDARASVTPMSLFAAAGYSDAELSSPATDTPDLNTWVKATSTTGSIRFDHIAVSQSVSVVRTAIENPKLSGPASDHRLLWADIAISTS